MTLDEFKAQLAEAGVDQATIDAIVKNEKAAAKVTGLRQSREYDELAARAEALNKILEGDGNTPGAKKYMEWYQKNYGVIQSWQQELGQLRTAVGRYQERYGSLDDPKAGGTPSANAEPKFSAEDV